MFNAHRRLLRISVACLLLWPTSQLHGQASRRERSNVIELTSSNISDYLNRLRDSNSHADYVIKGEIRLSGSQEQWYMRSIRFDKDAVIFLGSTNLTIFAREITNIADRQHSQHQWSWKHGHYQPGRRRLSLAAKARWAAAKRAGKNAL
jgi:hypothetical protein